MHFTLPEKRLHNLFNSLDITLTSEPTEPSAEYSDELKLYIANSTRDQQDYYFVPEFLDILSYHYCAVIISFKWGKNENLFINL